MPTPRRTVTLLSAALIAANLAAWALAWSAFGGQPALLATALLAWVFGLRHAVDADHIAAIDNVVRKLMQHGARPISVGLWFSLGHSTIVVLASAVMVWAAPGLQARLTDLPHYGAVIGTLLSAGFLFVIALANISVLLDVWRLFRLVRGGGGLNPDVLRVTLAKRGLIARVFRPVFGLIGRGWHMYAVGFLFGLGFDTATEVGLLGLSVTQAAHGLPPWRVMVLPALFTAGMALVDSADCVLMVGAYGWAFFDPLRKLWYNLVITAVSVVVAVLIGGVEAIGLLADQGALHGWFWQAVGRLNDRFGALGLAATGFFALCWVISALVFRYRRHDVPA
jgi:high-affinity nickel-transport protein